MTRHPRYFAIALAGLMAVGCGAKTSAPAGGGTPSPGGGTSPGGGGGTTTDPGGGTPGGGTPAARTGIALPREISALPARAAGSHALRSVFRAFASAASLPADSDYAQARTVKHVDEHALDQFDIFNTIFGALQQTHYAEAVNVDQGPYAAMVTWLEDKGDSQEKQIIRWVVDSSLITVDGHDVNRVEVWMPQPGKDGSPGGMIKIRLDISEPPTQRADGTYSDYGVWRLDAKFGGNFDGKGPTPEQQPYFAATASRTEDGLSVIKVHDHSGEDMRGILERSDERGYGKVTFPDWTDCHSPDCQPTPVTASYVYDADHVALQKGASAPVFKDRADMVDLVNRYGLYDAATGADIAKTHSFGFPLRFTADGTESYGYYGAWQGRHQIWANGAQLTAGTVVHRGDRPPNDPGPAYTVTAPLSGTLVKRTLHPASVQDVKGLAVETWLNEQHQLRWDGTAWRDCPPPMPMQPPPFCGPDAPVFDVAQLAIDPSNTRRNVNVNYWDQANNRPVNLVYVAEGMDPGFYVSTGPQPPQPGTQPTLGAKFVPDLTSQLWVNIGGSIYISFNGTSWVQKKLVAFDQQTYTPTFDPEGDAPYALDIDREYYLNDHGTNYVVKATAADAWSVQVELQTVANPVNAATFLPAGTILKQQWGGTGGSTFSFDVASMKLVYETVGTQDASSNVVKGDVVATGQWGLVAWVNGASTGVQYNWDWPRDGENFGIQQFLKDEAGHFVLLEDPIRFAPIELQNHAGLSKTFALQFDGSWVQGLPDVWNDLQRSGFELTADIADKVVVIPDGTEVIDASGDSPKHYVFKPLQVSEYLSSSGDPGGLDLAIANGLDLQSVPTFVDHGMGPMPDVLVKYADGKPVQ